MDGWWSTVIFSSQLGIDTLLLLTGVIISFSFMATMEKKGHYNVLGLYLHRWLKIMPVLMVAVLIFMSLNPRLVDGPYSTFLLTSQIPACEDYWWSAMLFVQNYVNPNSICILHSWFLSAEMQLVWLSPLFLYPLYFYGRKFSWVVGFVVLLSIACVFTVSFFNEFMAFIALNFADLGNFARLIFMPTHTRMGPFFIGMFYGYLCSRLRGKKLVMNRVS